MAGAIAREGDMLSSGHGSFPPHPFPVGGSIAKDAFVEGVKMLCVGRWILHSSFTKSTKFTTKN